MKSNTTYTYFDVEVTHRTQKAVLVHTGNKEESVWLPLSQIEISDSGFPGIETITMPEWLAVEKGFL